VEFSKSSELLYITSYDGTGTLCQYNISLPTAPQILASRVGLSATDYLYGLQMGPDGKIYVARSFGTNFLGVINFPETVGFSSNYVDSGIDLDPDFMGVNGGLSLPGFMQTYLKVATGAVCPLTGIEENNTENSIVVYPNPSGNEFTIDLSSNHAELLQIFDYSGRSIEEHTNVNSVFTFGKEYAKGVYFVRTISGAQTQVHRVIKM
jgi:hypothetical protein